MDTALHSQIPNESATSRRRSARLTAPRLPARPHRPTLTGPLRALTKLGLIVWAGFWTWFAAMNALGEGPAALVPAATLIAILLSSALLAWTRPRLGGLVLVGVGAMFAVFFQSGQAFLLLALPALLMGTTGVVLGKRRNTRA